MRFSSFATAIAASAALIQGAPIESRDVEKRADYYAPTGGDVTILNYALTLEYLERKFYQEGLAKFSQKDFINAGFPDPFYANLKEIYYDELTHVSFLAGALTGIGATPVTEASYKFPYTDAKSFIGLSSVLEGVGVSAYLGAAAAIVEKAYLTAAGSILTVEARHSSYIRAALAQSPFPKPFDTPLDFNQVFSLAAQFITAFNPKDPALPFKAFPPITLRPSQYDYVAGSSSVTFTNGFSNAMALGKGIVASTKVYAVLFSGLDKYYVPVRITQGDKDYKFDQIPGAEGGKLAPTGQVYVVLSTADGVTTPVSDDNTLSGVGVLEVKPPRH